MEVGASPRASENLVEHVRASAAAQGATRLVVLIDGHSGSGKTTLATQLADRLEALQVSLDDMYPGWGGLEVGSAMVRGVLDPDAPGYRRWDWNTNQPAGWRAIPGDRDLVIEGSGAMSQANRALATFGIWVRLDQEERKRRALARDGPAIHQNWDRWTAQEQAFFARERPDTLADAIMDGRTGEFVFRADQVGPDK
jgi:energy-coupling factor transporter ATP-binding protein EcfA2